MDPNELLLFEYLLFSLSAEVAESALKKYFAVRYGKKIHRLDNASLVPWLDYTVPFKQLL
jgi:hypothetical protein